MARKARKKITKHPTRAVLVHDGNISGFQLTFHVYGKVLDICQAEGVQYLPTKQEPHPCNCRPDAKN